MPLNLEELILAATDHTNTGDDWDKIIQICDLADRNESAAREAVNCVSRRLAHKNVNVILFSLTVVNSLVQNCGLSVKKEICSRVFLDSITRVLKNPSVHSTVRARILDLISQWADSFKTEDSLDYMIQVYNQLQAQGFDFTPSKPSPAKKTTFDHDKAKEEEEFQLALALSLSAQEADRSRTQNSRPKSGQSFHKAESLFQVRALYDFRGTEEGELSLTRGDVVDVYDCTTFQDWWKGSLRGQVGIFPSNYVERVENNGSAGGVAGLAQGSSQPKFTAQAISEHQMKVTQFLDLLSRTDPYSSDYMAAERIRNHYQEILDLRPVVIQNAEAHRKKQDELTTLNERLNKALNGYQKLMDGYMQYQQQLSAQSYAVHSQGYPPTSLPPQAYTYGQNPGYAAQPPYMPPSQPTYTAAPSPAAPVNAAYTTPPPPGAPSVQHYGYPPQQPGPNAVQGFPGAPYAQAPPQQQAFPPNPAYVNPSVPRSY